MSGVTESPPPPGRDPKMLSPGGRSWSVPRPRPPGLPRRCFRSWWFAPKFIPPCMNELCGWLADGMAGLRPLAHILPGRPLPATALCRPRGQLYATRGRNGLCAEWALCLWLFPVQCVGYIISLFLPSVTAHMGGGDIYKKLCGFLEQQAGSQLIRIGWVWFILTGQEPCVRSRM